MITWERIEAIDSYMPYFETLKIGIEGSIKKRKPLFEVFSRLWSDLENLHESMINELLTANYKGEILNVIEFTSPKEYAFTEYESFDLACIHSINDRIEHIKVNFEALKDLHFKERTIYYDNSPDAVAEIQKELHEIEDKRDQLNRRGESLSKLDSDLMNFLNTQLKRREGLPIKKQIKEKPAPITTLLEAFDSPSKYQKIMQLMVDKGFIQSLTYIWKDEKNSNLGTIVSVLKVLHFQKYYTDNRRLKPEEIKQIIKNTFGRDISSGYIKHHKLPEKDKTFNFIPIASTLI